MLAQATSRRRGKRRPGVAWKDAPRPACCSRQRLTTDVGLDGIRCIDQRLPLGRRERPGVDEALDLIDEGIELATRRVGLPPIELGDETCPV